MRIHQIIAPVTLSFLPLALHASTHGTSAAKSWSPVATVTLGSAWSNSAQSETFYLQPDVQKTYDARKNTQTLFSGELFLGAQKRLSSRYLGQLGLAYGALSSASEVGEIWEDADPEFNNFDYAYKTHHQRLVLKGKLLADLDKWVMPYLSGSLGLGFNRASDYASVPRIPEEVPAPAFSSQSNTTLTYSLGLGVQKDLNQHWNLGVGYEFTNWGKTSLGKAPGQTLNTGLSLSHFYTNALLFSLTYVA